MVTSFPRQHTSALVYGLILATCLIFGLQAEMIVDRYIPKEAWGLQAPSVAWCSLLVVFAVIASWNAWKYQRKPFEPSQLGGQKVGMDYRFLWYKEVNAASKEKQTRLVIIYAFCLASLAVAATITFGSSAVPYRGDSSKWADSMVLSLAITTFLFLLGQVLAEGQLVHLWLSDALNMVETSREKAQELAGKSDNLILTAKMLRELVEQAGEITGRLHSRIVQPFIVSALLLVSRIGVFDNWVMSAGLALIFAVNLGLLWTSWYLVMKRAARLKREVIADLNDRVSHAKEPVKGGARASHDAESDALIHVKECHLGAYGSTWRNPIVDGALIYLSGSGLQLGLPELLHRLTG